MRYHFLGAGGIGMSALIHILLEEGHEVSGSDLIPLPHLEARGLRSVAALPKEGRVIYSSAIPQSHSLLLEARMRGLPLLHRSQLLAELLATKRGLLIAGTHGKSSTSALLTWVLTCAGYHPTFAVGGILSNLDKNGGAGEGSDFVAEADESDGSFTCYKGVGGIITNIEAEHLDYWGSEQQLLAGFKQFTQGISNKEEQLFWCKEDLHLSALNLPGISYGEGGELALLSFEQRGAHSHFTARFQGQLYHDISLPLIGRELTLNALAVFGLALTLGIEAEQIRAAFATFKGVKRRQEYVGSASGVLLYDDYAHHPTEIKALLTGLKAAFPNRRLLPLFQPHRYSRTRALFSSFCAAFHIADLPLITDLYPAGEAPLPEISGRALARSIEGAHFIPQGQLQKELPPLLRPGDLLITMGAGDITTYKERLLEALA